jgi:phosphoribosylamine--glycine ligase
MKILIIGSGGREHALAWQFARYGHTVISAPGNPGMAALGSCRITPDYLAVAQAERPDLTVVGPEAPLVAGVVDAFRADGFPIIGPTQACAQLEGSKVYSKQFMARIGLPTARARTVSSQAEAASALRDFGLPVVVKADGLAAGKGVIIARTPDEARTAVETLGERLVIEEYLEGEEVSFIALCDGKTAIPLEATQDHKRVGDGDTGPNTGGMGAYCDGRILTPAQAQAIHETIILPAVAATGFTGFLYAGLMMTADGPKILEFNVRLGDPETQPLMHRLDCDFAEVLLAAAHGQLASHTLKWKSDSSVCVVLAASGYPGAPRTGDGIEGVEAAPAVVFQAGTKQQNGRLVTAGGRVLGVTAGGPTLPEAIQAAYRAVEAIRFEGMQYRRDIGAKGLSRWRR